MDIEGKLAEYRARKRRQALIDRANKTLKSFFTSAPKTNLMSSPTEDKSGSAESQVLISSEADTELLQSDTESEDSEIGYFTWVNVVTYMLYFVLWVTLFIIFIKLQFGVVFFIVSALVAMYLNTRTGPRRRGEVSAYSVFNANCESIDGTLKAEQFEREIRYGSGSVH